MLKRLTDVIQGKAPAGHKRSSKWPSVRKAHLVENSTCALCGGTKKLEVHHIVPFAVDSTLELDPGNLITLCESKSFGVTCHRFAGHLGSYRKANPDVRADAAYWLAKLVSRP